MSKTAFLGATRGMGRSLSRAMAERGHALHLLGRNLGDVERSAEDLSARGVRRVTFSRCDLDEPHTFASALDEADQKLGGLERVIVTAGIFGTQEELEEDRARAARVLQTNYVNTVLFCEEARARLLFRGGGHLVVFSSVAGERGRKPVVLYGSTKAGLSAYLEGLDVRYRSRGLYVTTIKPGFIRTTMTADLREPPFAVDPDDVAPRIMRAIERRACVVYAPPVWALLMAVIRALPRAVMRRVSF